MELVSAVGFGCCLGLAVLDGSLVNMTCHFYVSTNKPLLLMYTKHESKQDVVDLAAPALIPKYVCTSSMQSLIPQSCLR